MIFTYTYFFSFSYKHGFGNGSFDTKHKIKSIEDINLLTKQLEDIHGVKDLTILNYKLLETTFSLF